MSFSSSNSAPRAEAPAPHECPIDLDAREDSEKHVIRSAFSRDSLDCGAEESTDLRRRVLCLAQAFQERALPQRLATGVELAELRLEEVEDKLRRVLDLAKTGAAPEKFPSSEKHSGTRKRGFTSQFSSCRSIEENRSPPDEKILEEKPGRVLFANLPKRGSRLLMREFISKNIVVKKGAVQSPFEKKSPVKPEFVPESAERAEKLPKSAQSAKGLEVENLRLQNLLANEVQRRERLERDLAEGKEGLERLLESMPLKVKQSPLLKTREKHFREVLELVKFQVDEYRSAIKDFKRRSCQEFSEDSEGKTEDLVGTSVLNSAQDPSEDAEEQREWKWPEPGSGARRKGAQGSRRATGRRSLGALTAEASKHVSKDSSAQFDWGDHGERGSATSPEELKKTLNIEIPESETLRTEDYSPKEESGQKVTFEEMKRKQMRVQGATPVEPDSRDDLYSNSGSKRGRLVLEKLGRRRRELLESVKSAEDRGTVEALLSEVETEVRGFLRQLQGNDFESVGMNLYRQTSQKYSEGLQERLLEIEEKYTNLEREMVELRSENEKMRRGKPSEEAQDCGSETRDAEAQGEEAPREAGEVEREPEEGQAEEGAGEDALRGEEAAGEGEDAEITEEINEMIFDLLEVIEDQNISTVEKMKVIRIFLHHTHDLLGNQDQVYLVEQSGEFSTVEGEGSQANELAQNAQASLERNLHERYGAPREDTSLECWGEKLEAVAEARENFLSREALAVEEKQLTEIKEAEGFEEYDSQDPRSQFGNFPEPEPAKEFPDDRGYSSLEVLHDRAGETEKPGREIFDRAFLSRARATEKVRLGEDLLRRSKAEEALQDQVNELEDEKVGLKNKNIMLSDKISFLNQKLVLLESRLEEMEKSYLAAKAEKKEVRSRYEAKSKRLKEALQRAAELEKEKKALEEELERLTEEAEKKEEQVQEILEKVESLQEMNRQLATENELKSQELLEYSLVRSSVNTGACKADSERHSGGEEARAESGQARPERFAGAEKSSSDNFRTEGLSPRGIFSGDLRANQMGPREEARDRSEYPKGFGIQQVHLEEIVDQKKEIMRLRREKHSLISKMNDLKEDAKLSCFKYEENLRELKQKLKKFKRREGPSFSGSTWLKKKVSSCKMENELRKKNLKISKLTGQVQRLQGQVKTLSQDPLAKRFTNSQRVPSNTESKNSLYQRE